LTIGIVATAGGLILSFAESDTVDLLLWAGLLLNLGVPTLLGGLVISGVSWRLANVAEGETVAESGSGNTEPESDLGVAGKAIEDGEWPRRN
jgi:hypothetical protein